ncbi:MAG: hypothetical protein Q7R52_02690 [archaeon]|nr:hypothetical protein [archaeon]
MKVKISITIDEDLLKAINRMRGKIKLSTFIEGLLIDQIGR